MMRVASVVYRVIYLSVLLLFLVALVEEIAGWGSSRQPVLDVALEAAAVTVGFAQCVLVTVRFSAARRGAAWITTSAWVALFTWYCWFSWRGLFLPHEVHTFDPRAARSEAAQHIAGALGLFVALGLFFLSFPLMKKTFSEPRD